MQFTTASLTDKGLVRQENEDRLLCIVDMGLFAVADGIGGLPKGAEAAECAITTLENQTRKSVAKGDPVDLAAAVVQANAAVIELAQRLTPSTGLGCTLCAGLIRSGSLQIANVGDSRCYLFRDGFMSLLTTDDTVEHEVEMRRSRGENVTLDERYRNALTRCIGQPMELDLKIHAHSLQKNDLLLFCTDGINRMIPDSAILARFREGKSPEATLHALVDDAMEAGGGDNATGVIVRIETI